MDEPRYTLDEIKRALIADHYGEGRAGDDSYDDYVSGEHDKQKGREQFERLRGYLAYVRMHPEAWKDDDD